MIDIIKKTHKKTNNQKKKGDTNYVAPDAWCFVCFVQNPHILSLPIVFIKNTVSYTSNSLFSLQNKLQAHFYGIKEFQVNMYGVT